MSSNSLKAAPKYSPLSGLRVRGPNRIKELRERGKACCGFWLSQREVANALGLNHATVSRHENGKSPITEEDVVRYALLLKVKPEEIHGPTSFTTESEAVSRPHIKDEVDELTDLFRKHRK